jgi:DNA-binding MarR family transcriptional regulator
VDKILPEHLSHLKDVPKNPKFEGKDNINLHTSYSNYMLFLCVAATLNEKGSLTMGELSRAISVPLSTATRMVDWMVDRDYAERLSDSSDRRIVRVALTANGHKLSQEAKGYLFEHATAVLRRLPKATQKFLLINMKDVMGAWEAVLDESQ